MQANLAWDRYFDIGGMTSKLQFQKVLDLAAKLDLSSGGSGSSSTSGQSILAMDKDGIRLDALLRVFKCWDPIDIADNMPLFQELIGTAYAKNSPIIMCDAILFTMIFPSIPAASGDAAAQGCLQFARTALAGAREHSGTDLGRRCLIQAFGWYGPLSDMCNTYEIAKAGGVELWDPATLLGPRGSLVTDIYLEAYDFATDQEAMVETFSCNLVMCSPGAFYGLLMFWGESERATAVINQAVQCTKILEASVIATGKRGEDFHNLTLVWCYCSLPFALLLLGLREEAFGVLKKAFKTYSEIPKLAAEFTRPTPMVRPHSDRHISGTWFPLESIVFCLQMAWLCCCPVGNVTAEEAFAGLPSAAEMNQYAYTLGEGDPRPEFSWMKMTDYDCMPWAAFALERFGMPEKALEYAAAADRPMWLTPSEFCTPINARTHAMSYLCRGRCFAALGRPEEAAAAFKTAVADAKSCKYEFMEAVVLRDWNKHVRTPAGGVEAAEGERQFQAAMDRMRLNNTNAAHLEQAVAKALIMC